MLTINAISDSHDVFQNVPSKVMYFDSSGSITPEEMESFLKEIAALTRTAEAQDRWLNFSHKLRNTGKEMKPRVLNQSNKTRFKLSDITRKYEFMFNDGQV